MPPATLTSRGRITLPKRIREILRVQSGDVVDFVISADGVIRVCVVSADVSELRGLLQRPFRRAVSVQHMDKAIRRAARRS